MRASPVALVLLLPAFLISSAAQAEKRAQADRFPAKGTPFEEARAQLLAQGYEPDKNIDGGLGCSIGFEDVCKAYKETYSCSGTGLALCKFVYWKDEGSRTVMLTTSGEEKQRVHEVRILSEREASKLYHQ